MLLNFGFVQSKRDYSLFTKKSHNGFLAALVYVDDVLLTGDDIQGISSVKIALDKALTSRISDSPDISLALRYADLKGAS